MLNSGMQFIALNIKAPEHMVSNLENFAKAINIHDQ